MKPLAKLGYLAAACALLVATFSFIGPRAVRAAVATLVQVANTTAQPVPNLDMNTPGEETFYVTLCSQCPGNHGITATVLVPTETADGRQVKRLVITRAEGDYCAPSADSYLKTHTDGAFGSFHSPTVSGNYAVWNGPFFADPNQNIEFYASSQITCSFFAWGYYLTQ